MAASLSALVRVSSKSASCPLIVLWPYFDLSEARRLKHKWIIIAPVQYHWQQFNMCQAHSKPPVPVASIYPFSDGGWLSWLPIQVAPHERMHCASKDSRPVPKFSQTLLYGFITDHRSHDHLHTRRRFPSRSLAPWHRSTVPAHIRFSGLPAPPLHLQRSQSS